MTRLPSYSVVMPIRNEEENLLRVADWLSAQTALPMQWILVDNGSTDTTVCLARQLSERYPWVVLIETDGSPAPARGAPIVRAFMDGLRKLAAPPPDVVVKLDADLSGEPDYFERLLEHFRDDPKLGIASGTCFELLDGTWSPTHATIGHVRGAARAYRWNCLQDVLPLEERMGWDGLDALKATTRGWRTATVDIPFRHHRKVGVRDSSEVQRWMVAGQQAYFMNYRPTYLLARALRWSATDPRAIAMVAGFLGEAARRAPRHRDESVRALLRERQRARRIPIRAAEALGYRTDRGRRHLHALVTRLSYAPASGRASRGRATPRTSRRG